jgi:hypothetical protein
MILAHKKEKETCAGNPAVQTAGRLDSEIIEWLAARKAARKSEYTAQMPAITEHPEGQAEAR